eukprot:Tbor_TRINITY_DN5345_c0_g2::TRINITY_DN5345_c0_g2_i1::g.4333::m.4333
MAKSARSKWKKLHRRQKAIEERPNVARKVHQLHKKLRLTAKGGISKVPPEEPESRFHFSKPSVKAGERLELPAMVTNPYGKTDTEQPHPQQVTYDTVDHYSPLAGTAFSYNDERRIQDGVALKAASLAVQETEDDDGPMEMVIGLNDDEDLTSSKLMPSKASENRIKSMLAKRGETTGSKKMKAPKTPISSTVTKKKKK